MCCHSGACCLPGFGMASERAPVISCSIAGTYNSHLHERQHNIRRNSRCRLCSPHSTLCFHSDTVHKALSYSLQPIEPQDNALLHKLSFGTISMTLLLAAFGTSVFQTLSLFCSSRTLSSSRHPDPPLSRTPFSCRICKISGHCQIAYTLLVWFSDCNEE